MNTRVSRVSADVLANYFEDVKNGSSDLETYAAGRPEMADDLSSLANVAQSIAAPPEVRLEPLARSRMRAALIYDMAQSKRSAPKAPAGEFPTSARGALRNLIGILAGIERVPTVAAAAGIVLATTFGSGMVYAAEGALPGDALYPVRLSFESVQVALAPNDTARAEAFVHLAYNRLSDVDKVSTVGRVGAVDTAVNSYVDDVTNASQILSESTASDQSVLVLTNRLQTDFARHEGTVAAVELKAPDSPTTTILRHADDSAQSALQLAIARDHDHSQLAAAAAALNGARPTAGIVALAATATPRGGLAATGTSSGSGGSSSGHVSEVSTGATPATSPSPRPVVGPKPPASDGGRPGLNPPPPSGHGAGGRDRDNDGRHATVTTHRNARDSHVPVVHPKPVQRPPTHQPAKQPSVGSGSHPNHGGAPSHRAPSRGHSSH